MNAVTVLLLCAVGLLGTIVIVPGILVHLLLTLADRRGPRRYHVPIGMLCGYIGGALFIWSLVPRDWTLPLWSTIEAAFNVEKYGHAVEHFAERTFLWMLFGAVVGSVISGVIAAGIDAFLSTTCPRNRHRCCRCRPGMPRPFGFLPAE